MSVLSSTIECKFFQRGECRFGSNCAFRHSNNAVSVPTTTSTGEQETISAGLDDAMEFVIDRHGSIPQVVTQPMPDHTMNKRPIAAVDSSTRTSTGGVVMCIFFQQGLCRKGLQCRFVHFSEESLSTTNISGIPAHPSLDSTEGSNQMVSAAERILLKYSTSKKPRRAPPSDTISIVDHNPTPTSSTVSEKT